MNKILKTSLIIGGVTVVVGAIAYGVYRIAKIVTDEDFMAGFDPYDEDYDFDECCSCGCNK